MKQSKPSADRIRRAADAVAAFTAIALRSKLHRWGHGIAICVAELVWNTQGRAFDLIEPGTALAPLIQKLVEARRASWSDEHFMVMWLDVRRSDDQDVFTFEITWDKGQTVHPCEVVRPVKGNLPPPD